MLVISSMAEGLPLVAMEALAVGVPMVSYDCPVGPRAVIDDGVNGLLVRPNDVAELAAAIERLIDDDDLRVRLGNGAAGSRSRFAPAPHHRTVGSGHPRRRGGRGTLDGPDR